VKFEVLISLQLWHALEN